MTDAAVLVNQFFPHNISHFIYPQITSKILDYHQKNSQIKKTKHNVQRILVLQGGGALGAYEVGVLKFLSEYLKKDDKRKGVKLPLFDVIVGSSMGAVNGAILVHNVICPKIETNDSHRIWDSAIEMLHDFYMEISNPDTFHPLWWINKLCFENKMFDQFWIMLNILKKMAFATTSICNESLQSEQNYAYLIKAIKEKAEENTALLPFLNCAPFLNPEKYSTLPTAENARRYYYYLCSLLFGIPKVLSPALIQPDFVYFDPLWLTHIYTRFSNEPLVKAMKQFWNYDHFPIKTTEGQPRLLLTAVDVEDSSMPVIFDSHKKNEQKNSRYSEYGDHMQYKLEYQNGITADHVRASISTPLRHEYPSFKVFNKKSRQYETRHFWDGAFLSNSPVSEVLKMHMEYWQQQGCSKAPDLELYVVNLYPTVKTGIPKDPYSIQDRETDMKFQNRAYLDEIMDETNSRNALEGLLEYLMNFSNKNNLNLSDILEHDDDQIFSNTMKNKRCKAPAILKIVKIERKENVENSVFGKAFDFSRKTITKLIDDGYDDARTAIIQNKNSF